MKANDLIFAVGSLIFILALLPAVLSTEKPPVKTSAMTAAILFVFSGNYLDLGLWYSAAVTFVTASTWTVLAIQKRRINARL